MTSYLCVRWHHDDPESPVLLCSELDGERWETRKVEIYADGRMDFANAATSAGSTWLGAEPLPPADEIAADPQFEILPYSKNDFEQAWLEATKGKRA